jgi:hypothetical protein
MIKIVRPIKLGVGKIGANAIYSYGRILAYSF